MRGIYQNEEEYRVVIRIATKKPSKIFVSHSSQDLAFVQPLVELFEHIGLTPENMFCSSVAGYNVPLDNNIYDYLMEQFQNYDLRVIFVLSENYYSSPACLNEMGAAWVLQHRYTSVLLPQFDFRNIKGAIDQMRISIKLDSEILELKTRLDELRGTLVKEFGLELSLLSKNMWERHRDEFVEKVNSSFMRIGDKQSDISSGREGLVKPLESIQMIQKGDKNQQFAYASDIIIYND